jgi:K(+)-stimulated pyrophosphate-energized sodium pump
MALAAVGILASIIGTQLVRTKENATQGDLLRSIRNAAIITAILYTAGSIPLFVMLKFGLDAFGSPL